MTKYHAVRAVYAGEEHDSHGEAEYARTLDERKAAGAIRDWRRGRVWVLIDGPTPRDRLTLRPDFEVWRPDGSFYCLDFKGMITREFAVKAKVWKAVYPTVPLYVVKADGREVRM